VRVFILVENVHVRTKVSVPKDLGLMGVWFTECTLCNLLAGLWRKTWTYSETLIVYVCISGLSFKMLMLKSTCHGLGR